MAQRKASQPIQDNTPDYLVKPKAQFELDLGERIKMGEELLSAIANKANNYSETYAKYVSWNNFNEELLSRVFDKKNNQYYKDYTYTPSMSFISIGGGIADPNAHIGRLHTDISTHLTRLRHIKGKLVLIDELPGLATPSNAKSVDKQAEGLRRLETIFLRFHRVAQTLRRRHANRDTITIKDEYDVQDLLHGLLHLHFSDVRPEDYSTSYAGGNSRVDFTLKNEKIVVEVKMTNDNLKDKEVGNQLLIDIGRYRGHPDCEVLAVFVYDKGDHIQNKPDMIADLERMSAPGLKVRVFIEPQ